MPDIEQPPTVTMYDVRCPKCRAHAVAAMVPTGIRGSHREAFVKLGVARITCSHCGFAHESAPDEADAYELWYVTDFGGRRLWANNRLQLDHMIEWIAGGARLPRHADVDRASLETTPKWMRASKNRPALLAQLRRLRDDGP